MTTVQPFWSWVVVTDRPRGPELLEAVAVAWPEPLDEEETLTPAAAPGPDEVTCALSPDRPWCAPRVGGRSMRRPFDR